MKRIALIALIVMGLMVISACGKKSTPEPVMDEFDNLVANLDPDTPGQNVQKLEAFREKNTRYVITDKATAQIERIREQVLGRYVIARDLAREGDVERAQIILNDLADHFSDTPDGRQARDYLRFDFHLFKISRLSSQGKYDEAESALKRLREGDITPVQKQNLERMLDAITQARDMQFQSACRMLFINLMKYQVEQGQFPGNLSIKNLNFMRQADQQKVQSSISEIENFRGFQDSFEMTAVRSDGKDRRRITEDGVQQD